MGFKNNVNLLITRYTSIPSSKEKWQKYIKQDGAIPIKDDDVLTPDIESG